MHYSGSNNAPSSYMAMHLHLLGSSSQCPNASSALDKPNLDGPMLSVGLGLQLFRRTLLSQAQTLRFGMNRLHTVDIYNRVRMHMNRIVFPCF